MDDYVFLGLTKGQLFCDYPREMMDMAIKTQINSFQESNIRYYYLNIAIHTINPGVETAFHLAIESAVEEFDQKLFRKEVDKDSNQLTLCYRGRFAELAVFADNVMTLLEDFPFRIEIFFGDLPITGNSLCLWENEALDDLPTD
jgi:hypothetical protein